MCCDPCGASPTNKDEYIAPCPDCGEDAVYDKHGNISSMDVCSYSPEECKTCGWRPCDQSC